MNNKILVTGATGTVGHEVVKQLAAVRADVRAGVHSLAKAATFKGLGVEIEEVHYDRPETIDKAL
ncbi:MAG: NmrA family NAD(P)-binding protein [Candidatus Aminicenantes bacterium]|jgi:uncharacterized protein YbjT (DUF2867 family)